MRIIEELSAISESTAIALGMFDGIHLGHRAVIGQAVACAPKLTPAVFTFTVDRIPDSKQRFGRLLSPSRQSTIMEGLGCEILFRPAFSTIRQMKAEDFFAVLTNQLGAKAIFCGSDFRFGYKAQGNTVLLRQWCEEKGVFFREVPAVTENGTVISSTQIRGLIEKGDIEAANRLLGAPYSIDHPVSYGRQLGRTIAFPTINQLFDQSELLPRFGVYATKATVNGISYPGLTNVGVKPTVGENEPPSAETHLIGFSGDLYGKNILLEFFAFIREERKFASVEELRQQIEKDKEAVLAFFA